MFVISIDVIALELNLLLSVRLLGWTVWELREETTRIAAASDLQIVEMNFFA
jgi:hypothetical protein